MMLLQNLGLVLDDTIKISHVLKAVKDPEEKKQWNGSNQRRHWAKSRVQEPLDHFDLKGFQG